MFKGRLFKAVSLLIVVAMMNLMVACSTSKAPTGENSSIDKNRIDSAPLTGADNMDTQIQYVGNNTIKTFELPNGVSIDITDYKVSDDNYVIRFQYNSSGIIVIRDAVISFDFTKLNLYDLFGNRIYHYAVNLAEDSNSVDFTYDTDQDELIVSYYTNETRRRYEFMGDVVDISFENEDQLDSAGWLFQNYTEENKFILSQDDLALYEKIASVNQLFSAPSSFTDNTDAEVSAYMVGYEPFIKWAFTHDNEPSMKMKYPKWWNPFCHVANYATLTCACWFTGLCIIICVPAVGISIVCEVTYWYDVFSK